MHSPTLVSQIGRLAMPENNDQGETAITGKMKVPPRFTDVDMPALGVARDCGRMDA
jgi:hypothetical protein